MNIHEEQFAHSFIVPEKRARYLSLLESKRGRKKLLEGFYHCHDLDTRYAKPLPASQASDQAIEKLLKSKGAPEVCYVMSADSSLDGREMFLSEALFETVCGDGGTLISCIAGKLAYFELEPFDGRYILER